MVTARALASRARALVLGEGFSETCVPGVHIHSTSRPIERKPIVYDSWIVALLEGEKLLYRDGETLTFNQSNVLCVAAGTAIECSATASPRRPLTSLMLEINTEDLLSMATRVARLSAGEPTPPHVMGIVPMTPELRDTVWRLVNLLYVPHDAEVLAQGTITELVYRVLQGGFAQTLGGLASNRNTAAILRALRTIRSSFDRELSVETLARQAGMSVSSFHTHFKRTTSHSPLQYSKSMRLTKAQSLIRGGRCGIGEAALQVGYASASQFSHEYKKYFGVSPSEHAPDGPRRRTSTDPRFRP